MNYYVYYKIPPERAAEARSLVKALFAELEKRTGIRGRWMRRRDDAGARFGVQRKVERFISAETPA